MKKLIILLLFHGLLFAHLPGQVFEIKEGDKWGFINAKGEIIVPPQYEYIYDDYTYSQQKEGYFVFKQNGKMGVYVSGIGELVPAIYDKVKVFSNKEHTGYMEVTHEDRVGVLDTLGKMIIKPENEEITQIVPGIFKYRRGELWGTLNREGTFELSLTYDSIYSALNRFVIGRKEGKYSAWDKNGDQRFQASPFPYEFLSPNVLIFPAADTNLVGIVDSMARPIRPAVFDSIKHFEGPYFKIHKLDRIGLLDADGTIVLDTVLAQIDIDPNPNGLIWIRERGELWALVNFEGDTLAPAIFERYIRFQGNIAQIRTSDGWGVVNQYGDILTEEGYTQIEIIGLTVRYLSKDGWKSFSVNEDGSRSIKKKIMVRAKAKPQKRKAEKKEFWEVNPEDYGWFTYRGRYGWRDPQTREVRIKPIYTDVYVVPHLGITMVMINSVRRENRMVGLANHKVGRIITKAELNMIYIQDFGENQVARAQYGTGAFVLINSRGKIQLLKRTAFIGPFKEGMARAQSEALYAKLVVEPGVEPKVNDKKGKWGYLTLNGKWGVKPEHREVKDYHFGVGAFRKKIKWGAYDTLFNMIIPPQFDSVFVALDEKDTLPEGVNPLISTKDQNRKFFFLDQAGNLLFSKMLEDAGDFHEGIAKVKMNGKWGYIDSLGEMVVEPIFERAGDFIEGVARVRYKLRWGFINHEGEYAIEPQFMGAGDFVNGIAKVKEGARFGYVKKDGSFVIRPNYYRATDFYRGSAITRRKNNYGVINERGGNIVPHAYDRIYRDGNFFKVIKKGKIGFYSVDGELVKPPTYNYVGKFVEGRARVRDGKYFGFIDTSRVEITPVIYSFVRDFKHGLGSAKLNGKWGLIDNAGNTVLGHRFRNVDPQNGKLMKVVEKKYWDFIPLDTSYETDVWIEPDHSPQYSEIFETVKGKFGYDDIHAPREKIIVASSGQLFGLANMSGAILFDPKFEKITYRDGLYKVVNDGNIGYLNEKGEWIYPTEKADPAARMKDE